MKRDQKGMGAVEGLLVIIIALLVVFIGYYVYHTRNNTNSIYNNASNTSSTSKSTNPYSGWKTYTGKVSDDAQNPAVEADQVVYTLKYPGDWNFYPIGADTHPDGKSAPNSFQEIAPSLSSDKSLAFHSIATSKNAQEYYMSSVGDQSKLVGPVWQGVKSFTPENGYSAYTAKLDSSPGPVYDTFVSNNKSGLVEFHYGSATAGDDATLQKIFDSVNIP